MVHNKALNILNGEFTPLLGQYMYIYWPPTAFPLCMLDLKSAVTELLVGKPCSCSDDALIILQIYFINIYMEELYLKKKVKNGRIIMKKKPVLLPRLWIRFEFFSFFFFSFFFALCKNLDGQIIFDSILVKNTTLPFVK